MSVIWICRIRTTVASLDQPPQAPLDRFPATSWTVIKDAGENGAAALEQLCRTYWTPVYSFICHRGYDAESARDLTQSFFASALENGWFGQARRERGKFRSFLLASVRHFLANQWDRNMTQKRGGGLQAVYLDDETRRPGEESEFAEALTPELIFDRQCAIALLEAALSRLQQEYAVRSQSELFEHLRPFLAGEQDRGAYDSLEKSLNMSNGALRVAVCRLRQRYTELLRAEVAGTVSGPAEVDDEIHFLLAAVANP